MTVQKLNNIKFLRPADPLLPMHNLDQWVHHFNDGIPQDAADEEVNNAVCI